MSTEEKVIRAEYPSRIQTLIGLAIPQETLERFKRESTDALVALFPVRYNCLLTTSSGMLVSAKIITHCELADWCLWHGYALFSMESPPQLAEQGEKTEIG